MADNYISTYTGAQIDAGIAQSTTNKNDIDTIKNTLNHPQSGILVRLNRLDNSETGAILQVAINQTDIQNIQSNIGSINETLTDHTDRLTTSETAITTLQSSKVNAATLNDYYTKTETDTAIQRSLVGYATTTSVTDTSNAISQLEGVVNGLSSSLDSKDTAIQEVNAAVTTLSPLVAQNSEDIATAQTKITVLEGLIGDLSGEEGGDSVSSLSSQLTTINNNIEALDLNKADKTELVNSLSSKVDTTVFDEYQATIGQHLSDIDMRGQVEILQAHVGISTFTEAELNMLGIVPFPKQIEDLQTQITELSALVQDLTARLIALESSTS